MCNHCYHKYGRNSNADACPHPDRLVYAKGKCQNCYLNDYNKLKRRLKKEKKCHEDNDPASKRAKHSELDALPPQAEAQWKDKESLSESEATGSGTRLTAYDSSFY